MKKWNKGCLKDLITLNYGKSLPERDRVDGLIPVYGSGGISGYHNKALVNKPSIIIGRKGSIGTVQYSECSFFPIDTVFYVTLNNKEIDLRFVYYLLQQLNLKSLNTDAAVPGLNRDVAYSQKIIYPNHSIQKQIANILSNYDDLIENNNKRIKILEEMAQKIYKQWFVDFKFPGHETTTFKDSELGKIPSNWEIASIQDVVEFSNGYAFKSSELLNRFIPKSFAVFKQGHINRGGGFNNDGTKSWYPADKVKNLQKFILKKGDLLMAMTDMKNSVAILGNTAIMPVDNEYIVNQRVGLLRCNNNYNINYPYVYLLTNEARFLMNLRSRANSGVQVNLSSEQIKASKVIIPSLHINKRFDEIVKPIFEHMFLLYKKNLTLKQTRDMLLPKLISGEIDVENLEII